MTFAHSKKLGEMSLLDRDLTSPDLGEENSFVVSFAGICELAKDSKKWFGETCDDPSLIISIWLIPLPIEALP